MSAVEATQTGFEPAAVPLWREALFGVDWLALRLSQVYYGFGVPHGDGAPVIVIPGFLGSDTYFGPMYLGYGYTEGGDHALFLLFGGLF